MPTYQPIYADDLALVARIVEGDEDAAQEFYQTYTRKFESFARKRGVPCQDCQDVAHDALCDAFRQMRRQQFRGASKLSTWLVRILHGKIAEYFRHNPNAPVEPLDDQSWVEKHEKEFPQLPSDPELEANVREILRQMPLQSRAILLLKHTDGWTLEQISQMMDIRLNQASGRLYSAEKMFHRFLFEGKSSTRKSRRKALPGADAQSQEESYVRSIDSQTSLNMSVAGHQSIIDEILFQASERIGTAFGRGAFAGMRKLLAGSATTQRRRSGTTNRSQLVANAHAC